MVQTVLIELSIKAVQQGLKYKLMLTLLDISEICSMIQRLNSYNLVTEKFVENVPGTIYRPDKKARKVSQSWK